MSGIAHPSALRLQRGAALIFMGVAAYYLYTARNYPYLDDTGPGAGFFPAWVGLLGVIVGAGLLLTARLLASTAVEDEPPVPGSRVKIVATVAILSVAALALEPLGFRITTFLLLGVLLRLYGSSWIAAMTTGVVGGLLIYFVFDTLHVRLPVGMFGF